MLPLFAHTHDVTFHDWRQIEEEAENADSAPETENCWSGTVFGAVDSGYRQLTRFIVITIYSQVLTVLMQITVSSREIDLLL